jgi:hypothetical protein
MQFMHEVIKVDSDLNALLYTNLKEKMYDVPIVFKNDISQNKFDQLSVTLNGGNMQVIHLSLEYIIKIYQSINKQTFIRSLLAIIHCLSYTHTHGMTE